MEVILRIEPNIMYGRQVPAENEDIPFVGRAVIVTRMRFPWIFCRLWQEHMNTFQWNYSFICNVISQGLFKILKKIDMWQKISFDFWYKIV